MTISDLLDQAQKRHLRTEMEVFLSYLLGVDRLELVAHGEIEVPVEKLADLHMGWAQIENGMPVAYLTYEKEFYGLSFYVDDRVLVPRGETERLVEYTLDRAHRGMRVLEVGTGCGAISAALKNAQPDLEVIATDISEDALDVANKNFVQHGLDVKMIHSDLLESVPNEEFDVIVANLPYIGRETNNFISENVEKHEPEVALFGGSDGLELYEKMFEQIRGQDRNPRYILGEIGFTQGRGIEALAKKHLPHYDFTLMQDYQSLDRHFILERQ